MSSNGSEGGQWARIRVGDLRDAMQNAVPDWIRQVGAAGRQLVQNPRAFILTTVVGWFYFTFIYPVLAGVVRAGELLVEGVLILFLGRDMSLGSSGTLGLADIPLFIATQLIAVTSVPVSGVFFLMSSINDSIEAVAMQAGLAGPPVIALVTVIELGIVVYVLWAVIEALQLGPYLEIIAKPFRMLVSLIR